MPTLKASTVQRNITGQSFSEMIRGTSADDRIVAGGGDDLVYGLGGNDRIQGGSGFDVLFGGDGQDRLFGGTSGDFLFGGLGNDVLYGDGGHDTAKGADLSADRLSGKSGDDILVQGDGNDVMSGGSGSDTFLFRWQDPMVPLAAMTGRAFTTITDFNAGSDGLRFDVSGVGSDRADANFVDGAAGDGTAGGTASSFFSGAAADSNGESVVILTELGFASGADAVVAAQDEALSDLIVYFNSTVGVASLLFVDGTDAAHSIARFTNVNSIEELRSASFSADDFLFV